MVHSVYSVTTIYQKLLHMEAWMEQHRTMARLRLCRRLQGQAEGDGMRERFLHDLGKMAGATAAHGRRDVREA